MVASQVFFAVCTISVAVAAPQLGSRRTVTTTSREVSSNPDQIVTSVISALQQPIATAVAEALRGLQTTRTISTTGSTTGFGKTNSGFSSSGVSSSKGFSSSKSGFSSSKSSSEFSGATSGLGLASGVSSNSGVASQSSAPVDLGPYVKPEYNFEFKVSDDAAQTYITREEARDGTELTGSYKFVDPTGALVTVNYNAGVGGYEETREIQEGAVQMNAQPAVAYESSYESSAAADLAASQYAAAQRLAAEQAAAQRAADEQAAAQRASQQKSAAAFRAQQAAIKLASDKRIAAEKAAAQRLSASKTSTSNSNSNALIANILATLQPQIGAAVQSAIGTSRSVSSRRPVVQTSSIRAVSAPAVRTSSQTISSNQVSSISSSSGQASSSSGQASGLSSLFGNGGNLVRIATPKFQVEY